MVIRSLVNNWKKCGQEKDATEESHFFTVANQSFAIQKPLILARAPALLEPNNCTRFVELMNKNEPSVALATMAAIRRFIHYNELPGDWELEIENYHSSDIMPAADGFGESSLTLNSLFDVIVRATWNFVQRDGSTLFAVDARICRG